MRYNLKPFLLCCGISAAIGILLGVITLISSSSFSTSFISNKVNDEIDKELRELESDDSEATAAFEDTETVAVETQATGDGFSASFEGSVGGGKLKAFEITYNPDAGYTNISGRDSWNGSAYLPLEGHYDPDSGTLEITESNDGMVTGSLTGTLKIHSDYNLATYSGEFTNYKGRTYSFVLRGTLK